MNRKILQLDFEEYEDLQQRRGRTLREIDDRSAARVPAAGRMQSAVAVERRMIADPPEIHLRGQAVVDAVEKFLDEAGARFGHRELERGAAVEPALGRSQPPPRALAIAKDT